MLNHVGNVPETDARTRRRRISHVNTIDVEIAQRGLLVEKRSLIGSVHCCFTVLVLILVGIEIYFLNDANNWSESNKKTPDYPLVNIVLELRLWVLCLTVVPFLLTWLN